MRYLVDGDIVAYRCACAVDNNDDATEAMARYTIDHFMAGLLCQMGVYSGENYDYTVYLTGSKVYRDDIACTAPYKGNRTKERPTFYHAVREHLQEQWGAVMQEPYEADDLIAIAASEDLDNSCIMSLDKDFDQINCRRFNFVTNEFYPNPGPLNALRNLYSQCVIGDAVDNIIGAEGVGPGWAQITIGRATTELDMALMCIDLLGFDRFMENMQLVYLLRDYDDHYVPPTGVYDDYYVTGVGYGSEAA